MYLFGLVTNLGTNILFNIYLLKCTANKTCVQIIKYMYINVNFKINNKGVTMLVRSNTKMYNYLYLIASVWLATKYK